MKGLLDRRYQTLFACELGVHLGSVSSGCLPRAQPAGFRAFSSNEVLSPSFNKNTALLDGRCPVHVPLPAIDAFSLLSKQLPERSRSFDERHYVHTGCPAIETPYLKPLLTGTQPQEGPILSGMSFWTCACCTYVNQASSNSCDICQQARKPAAPPPRSSVLPSSSQDDHASKWGCRACTFLNKDSDNVCDICGTPRSHVSLDAFAEIDASLDEDEGIRGATKFWPLRSCSVTKPEFKDSHKSQEVAGTGAKSASASVTTTSSGHRKRKQSEQGIASMEADHANAGIISNSLLGQLHLEKLAREKQSDSNEEGPSICTSSMPSIATDSSSLGSEGSYIVILTYNVWFREDLELLARMNAISAIVLEHNPHFICFQEVTPNIYNIFQRSAWWDHYKCSVTPALASKRAYFCIQLSRMPNVTFHRKPFHNTVMGRELCVAKVELAGRKQLVVATTHLESPCPAPPTWDQMFSPERVSQAAESFKVLKENANVVFGGDMNWDDKLDGKPPLPEGWCDTWMDLRQGEEGITYDSKENPMLTGSRLRKRLDRLFCHLQDFRLGSIEMVGTKPISGVTFEKEMKVKKQPQKLTLPVLPSDHFGLLLKIYPK